MSTIESTPHARVYPPPPALAKAAAISGMAAYQALCAEAEKDFEGFWARLAREELLWSKPFTQVLDESNAPFYRWFHDGELNASYNCLDRHLETQPDKVAIVFEADDGKVTRSTYRDLYERVCRFANALKAEGVKKGDRVLIYMPMSPCRRARASARLTRWCSAGSPRRACRSASSTPAPPRSSPPTGNSGAARKCR
jgi:acetyl-CoA synthetase